MGFRWSRCRVAGAPAVALLLFAAGSAHAGGPLQVAGVTGFDPAVKGAPLRWKGGEIRYFTDPGRLGMLSHEEADALVAEMFTRWTSVATAAVQATRAGTLAEDVSSANVTADGAGVTLPADIRPTATELPVGIVYDDDGQVTETLLGAGSSDPVYCPTRAAYGGPDAAGSDGHYTHGLILLNGRCAQSAAQMPTLRYALVRAIGRLLGLGWSQANDNVRTGTPPPSGQDLEGVPVMHPYPVLCGAAYPAGCWPNADRLRMDDRAALARLYPVTEANLSSFPAKSVTASVTARLRGRIYFARPLRVPSQPMQGVNVVARWLDPVSGQASAMYVATSVSGFLFRGDGGNTVTGYLGPDGTRRDRYGSDEEVVEGWYDLGGLELPPGQATGSLQVSFEALNPMYAGEHAVGPAGVAGVAPSGTIAPVVIGAVSGGSDIERDFVAAGSALPFPDPREPNPAANPPPVPLVGEWYGAFWGYGDEDHFRFVGSPNSTVSVRITALGEDLQPARNKAQPVVGIWRGSDAADAAPALGAGPFNSIRAGATELRALLQSEETFRIGWADLRGDGRPDLRYHARVLYARRAWPERIPAGQGAMVTIEGIGFRPDTQVWVGGQTAPVRSFRVDRLVVDAPAFGQGAADIRVSDPGSGMESRIFGALYYGSVSSDRVANLTRANPPVPVGTEAPYPMRVRVESEQGWPLAGVPVMFRLTPEESVLPACGSAECTVLTDAAGEAEARILVRAAGIHATTATINSGAGVTSTLSGVSAATSVTAAPLLTLVTTGTALTLPIRARLVQDGAGVSGAGLQFTVTGANATLFPAGATTGGTGEAQTNLTISAMKGSVSVTACAAGGAPCGQASVQAVDPAQAMLQRIGPETLTGMAGQALPPVVVRALAAGDMAVRARLEYLAVITAPAGGAPCELSGGGCDYAIGKVLERQSGEVVTDEGGYARFLPTARTEWGPVTIAVSWRVLPNGTGGPSTQIQVVAAPDASQ
jgi:hypothetical protein